MPGIRILIADDTALLRHLLAAQLSSERDFEVVGAATDGRQAVELAQRLRPDVVLMDLEMPELNGTQATERILAQLPRTRVILLTAFESLAPLGRLAGAVECLIKSCTPEELAGTIRRAAATRPAPDAPASAGSLSLQALAQQHGLTERERLVVEQMVNTELTVLQIARVLRETSGIAATESSVKHALERALVKLQVEPRTRGALVRHVLLSGAGKALA